MNNIDASKMQWSNVIKARSRQIANLIANDVIAKMEVSRALSLSKMYTLLLFLANPISGSLEMVTMYS